MISFRHEPSMTSLSSSSAMGGETTTPLQLVLESNDEGVRLLREGCHREALQCFSSALSGSRSLLSDETSCSGNSEHSLSRRPCWTSSLADSLAPPTCDLHEMEGSFFVTPGNPHPLFVYQRGISLPYPTTATSEPLMHLNAIDSMILSSILTFNTALAMHQLALAPTKNKGSFTHHKQTLELYRMAWTLVDQLVDSEEEAPSDVRLLLAPIILNNVGCVYAQLSSWSKASECFWSILSTMHEEPCYDDDEDGAVTDIDHESSSVLMSSSASRRIHDMLYRNISFILFDMVPGQCAPCA